MGIILPHRRIHHTGSSEPTTMFYDDMSGSFSDNWDNYSVGGTATITGGYLKLQQTSRSGSSGAHAVSKTAFTPSGVQKLSWKIYTPDNNDFYDDDLTDGRCAIGLITNPHDINHSNPSWGYAIRNNRFDNVSTYAAIKAYHRTSRSNLLSVGAYVPTLASNYKSHSYTYSTGRNLLEASMTIDWDAATIDTEIDGSPGSAGQNSIPSSVISRMDDYMIYCMFITYASSPGPAEWDWIKLEQL